MKDIKTTALMTVVILAVGSISGVVTTQFAMGLRGGNVNGSIVACVYGACKDNTFNGGTSGGGGGGGQPAPTTGTLIVKKLIRDPLEQCVIEPETPGCSPDDYTITVTDDNPSPASFPGNKDGTKVTLDAGDYTVSEDGHIVPSFEGDCQQDPANLFSATGTIAAGQTQTCTITNEPPVG